MGEPAPLIYPRRISVGQDFLVERAEMPDLREQAVEERTRSPLGRLVRLALRAHRTLMCRQRHRPTSFDSVLHNARP